MADVCASRRRFLEGAARIAAASLLSLAPPRVIRNALAVAPAVRTGSLLDVEHIVILTQENRSFDHYFGTLSGVRGFGDPAAIQLPDGAPVWRQPCDRHQDGCVLPFHIDTHATSGVCAVAPEMSYLTDLAIWNEGRYDAWNTARSPGLGMGHVRRADLPFYHALADAFTICDHYFCSTLTQTNPNRLHLFSGSNGLSAGAEPALDNQVPDRGFEWTTCAELLEDAGVSWRVYQERNNFDDNACAWFRRFREAAPGSALARKGLEFVPNLVEAFAADVAAGTLPQVSWLVAPDYLSEHASYRPSDGEDICARLLAALVDNPAVWARTVFLLNYDEQGGWFDHVPPPMPPAHAEDGASSVSTAGEIHDGKPIGLGFRVPMLVLSPWSRGGWVCSEVFDHTSVIRLLEKRFGIACPHISPWRRAVCGDLTSALDFGVPDESRPRLPATRPYLPDADRICRSRQDPIVPQTQVLPRQEPGSRPSRALPYMLEVDATVGTSGVELDFVNRGHAGAVFQVYDRLAPAAAPRRYTVEAGKSLWGHWSFVPGRGYELVVTGPNGFVREFTGPDRAHGLSVRISYDVPGARLMVGIANADALGAQLEVRRPRDREPARMLLAAGARIDHGIEIGATGFWYDVTVTSDVPGFRRRAVGRMETGAHAHTDPALAAA